jgi:hypothetical protein
MQRRAYLLLLADALQPQRQQRQRKNQLLGLRQCLWQVQSLVRELWLGLQLYCLLLVGASRTYSSSSSSSATSSRS